MGIGNELTRTGPGVATVVVSDCWAQKERSPYLIKVAARRTTLRELRMDPGRKWGEVSASEE